MDAHPHLSAGRRRARRRLPLLGLLGLGLVAAGPAPEEAEVRHDMLVEAMDSLNDREKHILTERRLTENPQTLEELSQVYDVSRERIRQIEVRAFEKLQKAMKTIAGDRLLPGIA